MFLRCARIIGIVAALLAIVSAAHAQKRVALVIGNDRYAALPVLRNAGADARAVAGALQDIGFTVLKGENLDYRATNRLHADFEAAIAPGDTAFIFFAGHGVALGAENYLLPVDMQRPRAGEENLVRGESHSVDTLVRRIVARGAAASFFVIDACRDNPFEAIGTRNIGATRGMARVDAPSGVFVLFSAGIGQTALDRLDDRDTDINSIFTRKLVPLLRAPGLNHLQLAKRVQTEVATLAASARHQQQPAFYDQILGEIVFRPGTQNVPSADDIAWGVIKDTSDVAALKRFVSQFPTSSNRLEAERRIAALQGASSAPVTSPAPSEPAPRAEPARRQEPQVAVGLPSPPPAVSSPGHGEQFIPSLVYRTGAYAPNGIPFANGIADYYRLVNARDGGINGVKIVFEECDTGYATDRGVECYERLKSRGATGAAYIIPLSTGITFALTEKAPVDKIPIITMGYGRSESRDGSVFPWNFPLLGTYWTAADILVQHIAKIEGGMNRLRGKKIALVYHDSPYGKEPIALLQKRAQMHGFELLLLPVTHPGVEQKATWLQIRQNRPDYVLLWGWGVMNSTAIKEAVAVGYPREKMYGVWWSGAEPDVRPAGGGATGYNSVALQHSAGQFRLHDDLKRFVYERGQGAAKWEETGEVLYVRGLINAMLGVEAIRTAQERFGRKPLTGEQVRWGIENLNIAADRIRQLGFEGVIGPVRLSCADHEGTRMGRIQTWNGGTWKLTSDWYTADESVVTPLVNEAAAKYAAERKVNPGCLGN